MAVGIRVLVAVGITVLVAVGTMVGIIALGTTVGIITVGTTTVGITMVGKIPKLVSAKTVGVTCTTFCEDVELDENEASLFETPGRAVEFSILTLLELLEFSRFIFGISDLDAEK